MLKIIAIPVVDDTNGIARFRLRESTTKKSSQVWKSIQIEILQELLPIKELDIFEEWRPKNILQDLTVFATVVTIHIDIPGNEAVDQFAK